jgi:hypothetical protein
MEKKVRRSLIRYVIEQEKQPVVILSQLTDHPHKPGHIASFVRISVLLAAHAARPRSISRILILLTLIGDQHGRRGVFHTIHVTQRNPSADPLESRVMCTTAFD